MIRFFRRNILMKFSKILLSFLDYLLVIPASLLPQHFLSRQIHKLVRIESVRFKHLLISVFCKIYSVDLNMAEREDIRDYDSFNDFFTRSLKSSALPISEQLIVSPVVGKVSQAGDIKVDLLYQAKNFYFSLSDLLGNKPDLANEFTNGQFATLYLAPNDYHRVHMPCDGKLISMTYIPGRLFPVNQPSVRTVPNIFSRNERVVCVFETKYGKMLMILVGALFVGSIETIWAGEITPPRLDHIAEHVYQDDEQIELKKGEEMGRFNMGSTVILLFNQDFAKLNLTPDQVVNIGTAISSE